MYQEVLGLDGVTVVGVLHPEGYFIPADPTNADYRAYLAWVEDGNTPLPPEPWPIQYAGQVVVNTTARTTDDVPLEVFRFPTDELRLYRADLTIFGVDAGNFVSKAMEGRFTWKRTTAASAVMVGITVVSDIRDAAAAAWAPNALPDGPDIVFTVKGAVGRTIDWMLDGTVGQYAPGGLPPPAAFAELAPAEPPELISLAVLGLEPPPEPEPEPAPAETEA